ncbi:RNA-guided endonuclease InsQ/TnpB family protein [Microcoleus sp. herbarium12]|uniref:RNA-guided endonuclease InsQ/TnpB family protein n=1 Tax=Microcoleus sp. herbarium12 TaxID=3055437 RepID=UPI002FCFB32B
MQTLTYEYKLDPTPEQSPEEEKSLEICRAAYNYALPKRKDGVNSRQCSVNTGSCKQEYILPVGIHRPTFYTQCKSLTLVKEINRNLKIAHIHVLPQVLRSLEALLFVAMCDRGLSWYLSQKQMRSFVYFQLHKVSVKPEKVNIPKISPVKMRLSHPLPCGCQVMQVRVVKQANGFSVKLAPQAFVKVPKSMAYGCGVGIDLGRQHFLATPEGKLIARPQFFVRRQCKLKLLQRQSNYKTRGFRQLQGLQRRIALRRESISNTRKDFHFKTAHHLCDSAEMIFAIDLNLKTISAGMLCKDTLDAEFEQFLHILAHPCFNPDVCEAQVEANGTIKTCLYSQTHKSKKAFSAPVHKCQTCTNYETNRDVAVAQV